MDYVSYIRDKVGKDKIIMNASACIIVNDKDELLLQKRKDDGYWSLHGGIMEIGETYKEAVIRETYEELSIDIEVIDCIGIYHDPEKVFPSGDKAHIICAVFLAKHVSGDFSLDSNEVTDLKFFRYDNLPNIKAKDHLDAIHDYYKGIRNNII